MTELIEARSDISRVLHKHRPRLSKIFNKNTGTSDDQRWVARFLDVNFPLYSWRLIPIGSTAALLQAVIDRRARA